MNDRLLDVDIPASQSPDALSPGEKEEYRRRLAEKLKDPEFRKIEGFPHGTDEAILALSDPPYYTACPNPFLDEWIEQNAKPYDPETDDYHREPFAADVSEGKNHPIYNAHSYHTKVPHRAIMRYILHYTEPGDVVYDGFCGTGMTGVAAQLCADQAEVEALGADPKTGKSGDYKVDAEGNIWEREAWECHNAVRAGRANPHPHILEPKPFSKLGARKAILNDLSPAATFIAYNYNTPVDAGAFEREAKRILAEVEAECGWMYSTLHREKGKWNDAEWEAFVGQCAEGISKCQDAEQSKAYLLALQKQSTLGRINYMVWSDVFVCPACGEEIVFWEAAVDKEAGKVLDAFLCPQCRAETTKQRSDRKFVSRFDDALGETVRQAVQVPVLANYSIGTKRHEKDADAFDQALIALIDRLPMAHWFPTDRMPEGGNTTQPRVSHGLAYVHQFYTPRNLRFLAPCMSGPVPLFRALCLNAMTRSCSVLVAYNFKRGGNKPRAGTLYVSSIPVEANPANAMGNKLEDLRAAVVPLPKTSVIATNSSTHVLTASSVDYLFIDPPFGANINYSEMSFIWEAALRCFTNTDEEAIESKSQGKSLLDYQELMYRCFLAFFQALKPGRWATVEFHNSSNAVWNAVNEALSKAGFLVTDVRIIDKGHYSIMQYSAAAATERDLVISCYKPSERFTRDFELAKGTPQGVKEFLDQHLAMLPVAPVTPTGKLEQLAERTLGVLFDRMISYHLVNAARIPLSAVEFERLLGEHYFKEDGMWFLPNQLAAYQARKMRGAEAEQLTFYMQDEKSAVRWIRSELEEMEVTLGELTPKFMRELKEWPKSEPRPELRDLLREYFIMNPEGGTWAIPDPENEEHLATLRRQKMLSVFREYARVATKLHSFRKEAVIEGFKHCWQTQQYGMIVRVCERMKPADLQADRELMQFYDVAKDLVPPEAPVQTEFEWE